MPAVELRRRVSGEQQHPPQSRPPLENPDLPSDDIIVPIENCDSSTVDCCDRSTTTVVPPVPTHYRQRKTGRMETVTVTVVNPNTGEAGGYQSGTEGTTRERKISRVRRLSDALSHIAHNAGIITTNHPNQHGPIIVNANAGGYHGGGIEGTARERKISKVRKISNTVGMGGSESETEGTARERKISRVRKLSDALTHIAHNAGIITTSHPHQHGPVVLGTLTSQNSVSIADLLTEEEQLDTRSISSGSGGDDSSTGGITNLAYSHNNYNQHRDHARKSLGENGGIGPGHVLGPLPISVDENWDDGKKWPQVVASIAANMGAFAFGAVLAWSATGIASMDEKQDLGALSNSMSSWIGSIPTLGAVAACPFAGFALDTLGRKRSMLFLTLPFIIGWLFIGFAQNFIMVLFGRFVTGFCGGCFSIAAPIFTAETADPSIRGGLGSLFDLLLSTGMLYIYVIGIFLPWRYQAFACAIIPVAFHIIMYFVPESPRYLVQRDKDNKAEKAIYWLKGNTINPDFVQKEMSDLKTSVGENKDKAISIKEFLDRSLVMPTAIMIGLMFFTTLSGIDAVIAYTVTIFEDAGSTMDPKISTVIIGVVTMLASFPTAAVVDIAGRRILLMGSELVMAFALGVMGLYHYIKRTEIVLFGVIGLEDITWVPLASLILFIIGYSLGCGPLSMMMIGELLPNRLRGITSCIVLMTRWFLAFGVTNVFANMKEALHDDGTYWLLASVCAVGIFFVFFCVPETKGKTLAEIQLYFIGHKQSNIAIAAQQHPKKGLHGYDNKVDIDV